MPQGSPDAISRANTRKTLLRVAPEAAAIGPAAENTCKNKKTRK